MLRLRRGGNDRRQGRAILWAMTLIFILCVAVVMWAETRGNPHLLTLGADSSLNMEGRESLRYSRQQSVRGDHHRRLLRRGQCHA